MKKPKKGNGYCTPQLHSDTHKFAVKNWLGITLELYTLHKRVDDKLPLRYSVDILVLYDTVPTEV